MQEVFEIYNNYIAVVIPFDKSGFTDKNTDKNDFTVKLTEREKIIVELLKVNSNLTASEIAEKMSVTRQTINNHKTGYWKVK